MQNKKMLNIFFNISELIFIASIEPMQVAATPGNISFFITFFSIFLFLKWTINATTEDGIKAIKFTLWAICWLIFIKNTKEGISIVPPPIPNPLRIPDKIPIKKTINKTSFLLQ